MRQKASICRTH